MGDTRHKRDVLESAAGHVVYELRMWHWATVKLNEMNIVSPEVRDSPERNSVLECYLLHLRILIEFFRSSNPRHDDVVASDYVSSWSSEEHFATLGEAWTALNKRLTHLTAECANVVAWPLAQQSWQEAHKAVGELWTRFESALDEERRCWFHPELSSS